MKIGILTFHSQLNYGGVLQCWALKKTLEDLGHEVVVIDRRLDPENRLLRRPVYNLGLTGWSKKVVRSLLGGGDLEEVLRMFRTMRFIKSLNLTPYHFVSWSDAPRELGLDLIVVGSDQVWHCGDWGDPRPYLLEGCSPVRAISYAASFGTGKMPSEFEGLFRKCLGRFSAISCREREGVEICRGLGFASVQVTDPTQLVDRAVWEAFCGKRHICKDERQKLVCYFLDINAIDYVSTLTEFARRNNASVTVLVNTGLRPLLRNFLSLMDNFGCGLVRLHISAGPREFVRDFSEATWVISDSFHAVMFSSIFNCNMRFLKPSTSFRKTMFARVEEFASCCVDGPFFCSSVADAVSSIDGHDVVTFNREEIKARRAASYSWLKKALEP